MMRCAESNLYISQMNIVKTNTYYLLGVDDIYAMKSGGGGSGGISLFNRAKGWSAGCGTAGH